MKEFEFLRNRDELKKLSFSCVPIFSLSQMSLCIGLIAPGQMGSSLGKLILSHSTSAAPIRVITDLSKRSIRSQNLAKSAGIEDVGSLLKVVQQASIILSILNPSEAIGLARLIVETLKVGEKNSMNFKYFVDLNAIAPSTSQAIANLFQATSIKCVDGGILGGKCLFRLRIPYRTTFY